MALSRETLGLLFKLEADSKPAQAEIGQFKAFLSGQASQIKSEVTPALEGATTGFSGMGAAAAAATGPVGLVVSALALVTTATAGAVVGLFSLSRASADTGTKLFDLADKTGLSIRNLDLFRRAALEAGKGMDVVERSFDQFTSRLEQGSKTTGELNQTIKALGLDPKTALQDVNKSLETVVKNLNAIENPAIRGAKAQELFGLRNEAIVPILTRIGESLDAYERRVGSLGKITDEQTKQSKSFDVSLNILKATIGGVAQSVGAQMLPVFQAVIDLIQTVVRTMGEGLLVILGKGQGQITSVADAIDMMNAALKASPAFVNVVKVAFGEAMEVISRFVTIAKDAAKVVLAVSTGNLSGALAGASAVSDKIQNLTTGIGDKTKAALSSAVADTSKQFLQLRSDRAKLSVTGKEKPDLTGGAGKGKDQAAQDALAVQKIREQAAQREADAVIFEARRAFDFQQITIEQLTRQIIEAEKKKQAAQEATFAQERKLVNNSKLRAGEKEKRLAEIDERENAANQRTRQAIEQAEDQRRKVEASVFEQTARARGERQEEALRQDIARINAAADQRIITEETAARKVNDLEEQIFQQRRIRLIAERTLANEGSLERQKAADDLAKLEQERAGQVEQAQLRMAEAQRRDLANLRAYLQERNRLLEELQRGQLDALNQRAETLERRAQNSPQFQAQARAARTEALLAKEEFQNRLNESRIRADQQRAEAEATSNAQRLEARKLANQLLEQEQQRHQKVLDQITIEGRSAELQQQGFGPGLADAIAEEEKLVGRSLTLWEQLKLGQREQIEEMKAQLPSFTAVLEQTRSVVAGALTDMVASFVSGRASLREAVAGFFKAALAPLKDYLLKKSKIQFALGLADIADLNFAGAAKHFLAGAALAAVAGLIDAGGAAIAGSGAGGKSASPAAGGGGGGGAGGGVNGRGNDKNIIDQGGPLREQKPQVIVIRTEVGEGTVVKHWLEDFRGNGVTRSAARRDLLNET